MAPKKVTNTYQIDWSQFSLPKINIDKTLPHVKVVNELGAKYFKLIMALPIDQNLKNTLIDTYGPLSHHIAYNAYIDGCLDQSGTSTLSHQAPASQGRESDKEGLQLPRKTLDIQAVAGLHNELMTKVCQSIVSNFPPKNDQEIQAQKQLGEDILNGIRDAFKKGYQAALKSNEQGFKRKEPAEQLLHKNEQAQSCEGDEKPKSKKSKTE